MTNPRLLAILDHLRASRLADLKGSRVSVRLPISERLLNEVVAAVIPATAPVRFVELHPAAGNRIAVRIKLTRPDFLPPITVTAEIAEQPAWPDGPLVLRMLSLPGLISMAGAALPVASRLPPGVRLQDQRVLIDLPAIMEAQGLGEWVSFVESVTVQTEDGRLTLHLTLGV